MLQRDTEDTKVSFAFKDLPVQTGASSHVASGQRPGSEHEEAQKLLREGRGQDRLLLGQAPLRVRGDEGATRALLVLQGGGRGVGLGLGSTGWRQCRAARESAHRKERSKEHVRPGRNAGHMSNQLDALWALQPGLLATGPSRQWGAQQHP